MSDSFFKKHIDSLRENGNLRHIPGDRTGSDIIDFSANDYLGFGNLTPRDILAEQPDLIEAPMTSSASRLLSSSQKYYNDLEDMLSSLYGFGREALLFNSGYHANVGMVSALASLPATLILADKLVHASIIDGLKGIKNRIRFRHNDFAHLETLLEKEAGKHDRIIIIVESVYSMDGDSPDLEKLIKIKKKYSNIILYVDEAHAFGVLGPKGLGMTMATSNPEAFDIVIATFGKALGSYGAFAVVSADLKSFFVNSARSFIFSTSLPPFVVYWTEILIKRMIAADNLRAKLAENSKVLFAGLNRIMPDNNRTASHIGYFMIGNPHKAVEISKKLNELGLIVLPIRTPTVPPGTDRLRISLSARHTVKDIENLVSALEKAI